MITIDKINKTLFKGSRWKVERIDPEIKIGSKYKYFMICTCEFEEREIQALYKQGSSLDITKIPAVYKLEHYDELVDKNKELAKLLSDIKKPLVRLINDEYL